MHKSWKFNPKTMYVFVQMRKTSARISLDVYLLDLLLSFPELSCILCLYYKPCLGIFYSLMSPGNYLCNIHNYLEQLTTPKTSAKHIKKFYTTLSQIFEDVPGSSFAICLMHLESKEKRKVTWISLVVDEGGMKKQSRKISRMG